MSTASVGNETCRKEQEIYQQIVKVTTFLSGRPQGIHPGVVKKSNYVLQHDYLDSLLQSVFISR